MEIIYFKTFWLVVCKNISSYCVNLMIMEDFQVCVCVCIFIHFLFQSMKATKGFSVSDWCRNFDITFQGEQGKASVIWSVLIIN